MQLAWLGRGDLSPQARLLLAALLLNDGQGSYSWLKISVYLPDKTMRRALAELIANAAISVRVTDGTGSEFRVLPYQPAPVVHRPDERRAPSARVSEGMRRLKTLAKD